MWLGVVEDRADPEYLGRYRVRILGYHTANREVLPTSDLPWAVPVMPVTSASVSGIMDTPSLVEGSTVVGFFSDEDDQIPVIIGSLPGLPLERETDPNIGFYDPALIYPRNGEDPGYNQLGEPDISRLARGKDAETHASLKSKRQNRTEEIPRAVASSVVSVAEDKSGATYERETWSEPHPRFGSTKDGKYSDPGTVPTFDTGLTSVYPYNRVVETESGHVFEVDDTPGNGRIHEYHNSGTFYEIQHDGTRITKIVSDEYEITVGDRKVSISGNCDVTIAGNAKLYVKGDMYTEVDGNQFNTIRGDRVTKIGGNDVMEVLSDSNTQVNGNRGYRVAKDDSETIVGAQTHTVGKTKTTTVSGEVSETHLDKMTTVVATDYNVVSGGNTGIAAGGNIVESADGDVNTTAGGNRNETSVGPHTMTASVTYINQDTNIDGDVSITGTSTADVDHLSGSSLISGKNHTHTGDSGGTTTPPIGG